MPMNFIYCQYVQMQRTRVNLKFLLPILVALLVVVQFKFFHQFLILLPSLPYRLKTLSAAIQIVNDDDILNTSSSSSSTTTTATTMTMTTTVTAERQINSPTAIAADDSFVVSTFIIPEVPDRSIGEMLRAIIPNANNSFPLSSCSPTSQYKIVITRRSATSTSRAFPNKAGAGVAHGDTHHNETTNATTDTASSSFVEEQWTVESYDEYGQRKTQGGDEFHISFLHDGILTSTKTNITVSAIAIPKDNNDGTYSLDFMSPSLSPDYCMTTNNNKVVCSSSRGTLKLDMVYTCSIGRMTRPSKDHWKHGGYLQKKTYILDNITAPTSITKFEGPSKHLQPQLVDLAKFDKVICFGDSLLSNMCGLWWNKYIYKKPNLEVKGNFGSSIRSDLLLNETFPILEETHGKDLRNVNVSTAIILGSAAWEMSANLGPYPGHFFNDSLAMYHDLVVGVRERYPNVTVVWKSPEAVHLTVLEDECYRKIVTKKCINRVRYISNSIAQYLHEEQKSIMKKLNVPFLDVFDATYLAESWHMAGDCQHYRHWLNKRLLDYFYSAEATKGSLKRRKLQQNIVTDESLNESHVFYNPANPQSSSLPWWDLNLL